MTKRYVEKEKPNAGWLGVGIRDATYEEIAAYGLPRDGIVKITDVNEDSPAERAGIKLDDFVLSFDGQTVKTSEQFRRLIENHGARRRVNVVVLRHDKNMQREDRTLSVQLGRNMRGTKQEAQDTLVQQMYDGLSHDEGRLPNVWFALCAVLSGCFFKHRDTTRDDRVTAMQSTGASASDVLWQMLKDIVRREEWGEGYPDMQKVEALINEKINKLAVALAIAEKDTSQEKPDIRRAQQIWNLLPRNSEQVPHVAAYVIQQLAEWSERMKTAQVTMNERDLLFMACLRVADDAKREGLDIDRIETSALRDKVAEKIAPILEEAVRGSLESQRDSATLSRVMH